MLAQHSRLRQRFQPKACKISHPLGQEIHLFENGDVHYRKFQTGLPDSPVKTFTFPDHRGSGLNSTYGRNFMNIVNWFSNLEYSEYDDIVGIKVIKLTGNPEFSTYLTGPNVVSNGT
jgi:hypothetical protein